jgi:dTDP-4-dehydrorhamnose 3,5-epimerase
MIVHKMKCGAKLLRPEWSHDERGYCAEINVGPIVRELTVKSYANVLRGLHFQDPDKAPLSKTVRCVRGRVVEVIVDMRTGEPDFLTVLDADECSVLLIPPWCAHGYYVLSDDGATVHYGFDGPRSPEHERRVRWDSAGVGWGMLVKDPILSALDRDAPTLEQVMRTL